MLSVPSTLSETFSGRYMQDPAPHMCCRCCQSSLLRPLPQNNPTRQNMLFPPHLTELPRYRSKNLQHANDLGAVHFCKDMHKRARYLRPFLEVSTGCFRVTATPDPVFCTGKVPRCPCLLPLAEWTSK